MKLKQYVLAISTTVALSFSASTLADDTVDQAAKAVKNAWTDCGIGALIFKDMPVAAAVSNIIWDLGTTALISMAASPEQCKGINVASAVFINESIEQIETDISKGEGRHATAMLSLMGCDVANHAKVTAAIRNDIATDESFAELASTAKAQAMYLKTSQHVAACTVS
ncbi:DUF3015 domain-containing protein [Psychrosphaera sp. B3R10]|uniref:DUF3015 family protein n=1 Tax=Psychrosphaera algicola TaxID=3023714 RepID=A0ABT5FCV9_9GAMM|nr:MULTISPECIES: DUF3015 family protein [unclassified Psychrosphaera]MBU2883888.1 DUF3015 domain-containing protein [Psychrosphaera sp. I2R16]MBU2988751.1 DUF3015 domain-containing protein [Psychrosphaera sp. B3R10]MDC2888425.1 DUF3015 family protein [Psychrosphaera sp. G1-22]MDO6718561.1 DUF3015 family protein [Psychrosphaera sp. 1_MG-2023]